jgi:type IV secretion system protein VirB10
MMKRTMMRGLATALTLVIGTLASSGQSAVRPLRVAGGQEGVRVPVDTLFRLRLRQGLSSRTAQKGDTFTAEVIAPVVVGDVVAVPVGSIVTGRVTSVTRAARRRSGTIAVSFEELQLPSGQKYKIYGSLASVETPEGEKRPVGEEGEVKGGSSIKRDVVFIGGGAGVGAVIGAAAGGGKGAGIGAAVGAGLGTAAALLRKGAEVEVASGTEIGMVLDRELILPKSR